MLSDMQIVVAHFKEDLRPVRQWIPDAPILVYTKGPCATNGAILLPNVGYESQTWMHHFAQNYDALPKVTVCLQADPFFHFARDHDAIRQRIVDIKPNDFSLLPLAARGSGAAQSRDGGPHHLGLGPDLERMWRELLGYPPPNRWFTWYGGMFAVHRDVVRLRPKDFYEKGARIVTTKEEACAMERMWTTIFA